MFSQFPKKTVPELTPLPFSYVQNRIDKLFDAAKNRNQRSIDLVLNDVSINVKDERGHTVTTLLVLDDDLASALYLQEKYNASLRDIVFGLASKGDTVAVNKIMEKHEDLKPYLKFDAIRGYLFGKHEFVDEAYKIYETYQDGERSMAEYHWGLGAGLSGRDPKFTSDNAVFNQGLLEGYALKGDEKHVNEILAEVEGKYRDRFLSKVVQGYAQGNHTELVKNLINKNLAMSLSLHKDAVYGYALSGLIEPLNKLLASDLIPLTSFISNTVKGLAAGGHTRQCLAYARLCMASDKAAMSENDYNNLIYLLAANNHVAAAYNLVHTDINSKNAIEGFFYSGQLLEANAMFEELKASCGANTALVDETNLAIISELGKLGMMDQVVARQKYYEDIVEELKVNDDGNNKKKLEHNKALVKKSKSLATLGFAKSLLLYEIKDITVEEEKHHACSGIAESGYYDEALELAKKCKSYPYQELSAGFAKGGHYNLLGMLYDAAEDKHQRSIFNASFNLIKPFFTHHYNDAYLAFTMINSIDFCYAIATKLDQLNDSILISENRYKDMIKETGLLNKFLQTKNLHFSYASLMVNDPQKIWLLQGYQLILKNKLSSSAFFTIASFLCGFDHTKLNRLGYQQHSLFRPTKKTDPQQSLVDPKGVYWLSFNVPDIQVPENSNKRRKLNF